MKISDLKIVVGIIVALVPAVAGAILYFAPMELARANEEKIAMLDAKGQLEVWEDRRYEIEDQCIDKKTDEWICTQREYSKYERILREIKLLEKKLGIEGGP